MNLNLLDDSSTVRRRYSIARYVCPSFSGSRTLKRGLGWFKRSLWRIMKARANCCCSPSSSLMKYHHIHMNDLTFQLQFRNSNAAAAELLQSFNASPSYGEDTVVVKIGIVGDCQTGKTSLMENYVVGDRPSGDRSSGAVGISMDKVFDIQAAKIAMSIWELGEYRKLMAPVVCNDAAAIIILFDLTRRTTLHSVKQWFTTARECNKVALPVLVGTKFDQFIKMPESIRTVVTKQARLYAQAMGAPLVFTSIPYKINVNKVFKIVLARLFDLPCNISRNVEPGQPVVEY